MQHDDEHRHRCEVRALLRMRQLEGREWVRAWLYGSTGPDGKRVRGVADIRGQAAADRLAADAAEQWRLGNRGERGDWRA